MFDPIEYTAKFEGLIRLCAEAKAQGLGRVVVANPKVLGDSYEEVIESLSRISDANLSLEIADRSP